MSSVKGCNYGYDVRKDLTPQIPLNCRTLCVNIAAENTKSKERRVKVLLDNTIISVGALYQMDFIHDKTAFHLKRQQQNRRFMAERKAIYVCVHVQRRRLDYSPSVGLYLVLLMRVLV